MFESAQFLRNKFRFKSVNKAMKLITICYVLSRFNFRENENQKKKTCWNAKV